MRVARRAFRDVVARDLAPSVGLRLAERIAPAEFERGEPGFLGDLAHGGSARTLACLDDSLRKVPVPERAQQEVAPRAAVLSHDDDTRREARRGNVIFCHTGWLCVTGLC